MSEKKIRNRWLVVVGALLVQLCLGAIYAWGAFTDGLKSSQADMAFTVSPGLLGVADKADLARYDEVKAQVTAAKKEIKNLKEQLKKSDSAEIKSQVDTRQAQLDELLAGVLDSSGGTGVFSFTKEQLSRLRKYTFNFSATQLMAIFSVGLASFAVTMIKAGRIQDKIGPQKLAIAGGLVLAAGYILAGLVGTSFVGLLIFIGLIGGAGIGLGYVCPIAACVKWFPDLKGFVTGLAVAGFGAGAFIFLKLAGGWGNLVYNHGISYTFIAFGVIFAVCVTIGGLLLTNPPAGWKPPKWNPKTGAGGATKSKVKDLAQGEIIKTPQFWMIWTAFVFSAGCGLMVIGNLKDFGISAGLSGEAAGTALGLLALFNGLGRIAWGTISQKLTAKMSLVLMAMLQGVMMFMLVKMGGSTLALGIAGCWIGFNFGGNFALFPLLTLENFGGKNLGANYGAVFTAYGVGGIAGPIIAGYFRDSLGKFGPSFIIAAVACIAAALIGFALRPPKLEPAEEAVAAAEAD